MSELDIYEEVMRELGFRPLDNIKDELKSNLSPFYSRVGSMDFGFSRESYDTRYWEEQKKATTYQIWINPKSEAMCKMSPIRNFFPKSTQGEFLNFIIIGHDDVDRVIYFECVLSNEFIQNNSKYPDTTTTEVYHEITKENFCDKFGYMFRNAKIDVLTHSNQT